MKPWRVEYRAVIRESLRRALKEVWRPIPAVELERVCDALLSFGPTSRRRWAARAPERYRNPDIPVELIRRSFALRHSDPRQGLQVAQVAVEIATQLDLGQYGQMLKADLQAHAWSNLGNSLRLCGDYVAADDAFKRAASAEEKGSRYPLLRSDCMRMLAMLRRDQQRIPEALELATQAVSLAEGAGDLHRGAKHRAMLAMVHFRLGDTKEAILCNAIAARHLDVALEPDMAFALAHNTTLYLAADGRDGLALAFANAGEPFYAEMAEPLIRLRHRWLLGRLNANCGVLDEAALHLMAAREGFAERNLRYDAALATVDLALVWLRGGLASQAEAEAEALDRFLQMPDIPAEAILLFEEFQREARRWNRQAELEKLASQLRAMREGGPGQAPCGFS